MTRRKPLEWIDVGGRHLPGCEKCLGWIMQPGMAEAVASVGIEMPINTKRLVEQHHEGGHRDD